ncbi:DUF5667 domain-containing protein [Actinomycetospora termitidis]|uniref:DUF5667 domain-containing protein n=1 Tax=Actinomycetospora termitidis TaxID=3053470 RepID=A0ABT7M3R5_9PSEU|nr:DUF5667 domain-containing protein [Actinomycetospora sp. Odt1-22]MDL5155311.1 DUF5667 domain-containing protein [Actinomycetospora sp. Odt1-22]
MDTDLADDLRIADLLRDVAAATPGPDPAASARMRASVMAAITEQAAPAEESSTSRTLVTSPADAPTRSSHGRRRADRRGGTRPGDRRPAPAGSSGPRRSAVRRLMSTTVAGVACILALGALTVLLSRGSLPGDMLYGLKRASESAEVGLTSGQEAKGQKHLDIAALRLDEIQQMIQRDSSTAAGPRPTAAGLDEADAALVADNLRAFDQQARSGSKLLLGLVNRPAGPSPSTLTQWAGTQQKMFDSLSPSLSDSGRQQAASSQRLLTQLQDRARTFESDPTCGGSSSDELGPLPSASCRSAREGSSASTATPEASSSTPSSTTKTTTSTEPTTTTSDSDTSSTTSTGSDSSERTPTSTPDPVKVPVPVPGLPKVELPPLLPGLPGLSLG